MYGFCVLFVWCCRRYSLRAVVILIGGVFIWFELWRRKLYCWMWGYVEGGSSGCGFVEGEGFGYRSS